MPTRMVREGIIDSRAVNSLSDSGEILYRRLMSIVDDFGRYEADPEVLRMKLFWRQLGRWTMGRVQEAIGEVSRTQTDSGHFLITLYTFNGKRYLQLNNFDQRLRAKNSRCPAPDGHMTVACPADVRHMPALLPSDDGHMTAEGRKESEGVGRESEEKEGRPRVRAIPTTISIHSTAADFVDRLYAMSRKKRDRGAAERIIAEHISDGRIGAHGTSFEDVERRWGEANSSEDWSWKKGVKAQTLAEWVTDENYQYDVNEREHGEDTPQYRTWTPTPIPPEPQ